MTIVHLTKKGQTLPHLTINLKRSSCACISWMAYRSLSENSTDASWLSDSDADLFFWPFELLTEFASMYKRNMHLSFLFLPNPVKGQKQSMNCIHKYNIIFINKYYNYLFQSFIACFNGILENNGGKKMQKIFKNKTKTFADFRDLSQHQCGLCVWNLKLGSPSVE